jgi:hypothetical protein
MIFAAVLSPAIKIFHRHLGPNLLIFAVKVSPWFHRHFTVILWHITDISPWKNTDQGDFLLKRAVRAIDYNKMSKYIQKVERCSFLISRSVKCVTQTGDLLLLISSLILRCFAKTFSFIVHFYILETHRL